MMCLICHERPIFARRRCARCYRRGRDNGALIVRRHTPTRCACGKRAVASGQCRRCYHRDYMRDYNATKRKETPQNRCACGCGELCRRQYCQGHNRRAARQPQSPATKARISAGLQRYYQQRRSGHAR